MEKIYKYIHIYECSCPRRKTSSTYDPESGQDGNVNQPKEQIIFKIEGAPALVRKDVSNPYVFWDQ